jgi:O-antigen/teichoic acid export membrane protein
VTPLVEEEAEPAGTSTADDTAVAGEAATAAVRRLTRSFGWYGLTSILVAATPFLVVPLYVNRMSPSQYGEYETLTAILGFAGKAGCLGLPSGLFRFFSLAADGAERRIRVSAILTMALVSAIVGLLLFWTCGLMGMHGVLRSAPIWHAAAAYFGFAGILYGFAVLEPLGWSLLRAKQQAAKFAATNVVYVILLVGAVLYALPRGPEPIRNVLSAQVAVAAAMCALFGWYHRDFLALRWDPVQFREILKFTLPLAPTVLLGWTMDVSDRTILAHFHGSAAVATYALGYKIAYALNLVSGTFTLAWVPYLLAIHGRPGAAEQLGRLVTLYLAVLLLSGIALSAAAPPILTWIAPAVYHGSALLVLPVALGYAVNGVYVISTAGVHLSGNSRILLRSLALGSSLNVVLNLLFVPRFGGMAAAWVTTASFAATAVHAHCGLQKHMHLTVSRIHLMLLGVVAVAALLLALLQPLMSASGSAMAHAGLLIVSSLIFAGQYHHAAR